MSDSLWEFHVGQDSGHRYHASISRDERGVLHFGMCNLHPWSNEGAGFPVAELLADPARQAEVAGFMGGEALDSALKAARELSAKPARGGGAR